jgi:type I restriction enzyme S subunit
MELKQGYKQTEVGVIPEDWDVVTLGLIATIRDGTHQTPKYVPVGIPFYSVEHVTSGDFSNTKFISEEEHRFLTRSFRIEKGDVLMTRIGSIGDCVLVDWDVDASFYVSLALLKINGANAAYIAAYSELPAFKKEVDLHSLPSATPKKINLGPIADVRVALPSNPAEQESIAKALSDVDALLEGLDWLIAKKRDLKQAAMQQLLTGDTRLPGFEDEWRLVKFSDLTSPSHSRIDPSRLKPCNFCVELEHIEQGTGRLLGWSSTSPQSSLKAVFEPGDVLFGKLRAYLRKYWIADRPGVCSTEIWVFKPNTENVASGYLYQLVTTNWFIDAASTAYGTHMPRSDWKVIRELELQVPSPPEQEAIAHVLGDMDAEIEALEQLRAKTADLKQAMMQELLTGKTRLVQPQVSDEQAEAASNNAKGHNWAINEAVVIATLVKHFGGEDYPLGRKRYTKLSYLLHRHMEREADGYLKKAAGPYNPQTKYGGPEKIAKQNGYIKQHKGPKGHSGFIAADNIAQAEGYFEKWYGPEAIQWLEQFRFKKNDDLEVLATVDMAALELRASGKTVDVAAVKDVITSHPEWEAKLDRAAFSDAYIAEAIKQSDALLGSEIAGGSHA